MMMRARSWWWVLPLSLLGSGWAVAAEPGGAAETFARDIVSQGVFLTWGIAFVAGLGAVFSACVYPLIPITLAVIGARGAQSRGRSLVNAAVYVLGMATMYTSLGLLAAGLGKIAGFSHQNPWLMGFVVVVFFAMGLSMFGVWEIRLPSQWTERFVAGRSRYVGIFFMGLVSGIVAAPCTAPFMFNLLAYVSKTGNLALGGSTLFVFSLGLGLPFLVLGFFSSAIARLPKSGPWLWFVKYVFGSVMIGVALYYLQYLLGEAGALATAGAVLVLLGVSAARRYPLVEWTDRVLRYGGVVALAAGIGLYGHGLARAYQTLYAPPEAAALPGRTIAWLTVESQARQRARATGRPMLLDFWAGWCRPCKELERTVLRDPGVVAEARRFVAAKIDCTDSNDAVEKLFRRYGVSGLPAVVLVDSRGRVRADLTLKEKIPPARFVERMRRVR